MNQNNTMPLWILLIVAIIGIAAMLIANAPKNTTQESTSSSITGNFIWPFSQPATISCIDSDHGKDYNTTGSITTSTDGLDYCVLHDRCTSSSNLKEYYCTGNSAKSVSFICPTGCVNGRCLSNQSTCTGTCASIGYNCGSQTICGANINCGTCPTGNICNNGHCTSSNAEGYILMSANQASINPPMTLTNNNGIVFASSNTNESGSLTFNINILVDNTYIIWTHVLAPMVNADSFYVSVDNGQEDIYDTAEGLWSNNWQWTMVNGRAGTGTPLTINPRTFHLTPGNHNLTFRTREANSILDKILITSNQVYNPNSNNSSINSSNNSCTDTCSNNGFNCGTQNICGTNMNCGTCPTGNTCNNGHCTSSYVCTSGQCNGLTQACNNGQWVNCAAGQNCINGYCTTVTSCIAGNRCYNSTSYGYQYLNCQWSNITRCAGTCSNGACVNTPTCTDTCTSKGFNCGQQTICSTSTNCGSCSSGQTCNNGHCISNTPPSVTFSCNYYASPTGSGSGITSSNPMDLHVALSTSSPVHAGQTLCLEGGLYHGSYEVFLNGAAGNPVIVTSAPGQWAIIDNGNTNNDALWIKGNYVWIMNFEIRDSRTDGQRGEDGITYVNTDQSKVINMVVHDEEENDMSDFSASTNTEVYGNIVYAYGRMTADTNHGYAMYGQNNAPSVKTFESNFFFNGWGIFPVHWAGSSAAYLDNAIFRRNIIFGHTFYAGKNVIAIDGYYEQNVPHMITGNVWDNNYFYRADLWLGGFGTPGHNGAVVSNNLFYRGALTESADINTVLNNNYFGFSLNQVIVEQNKYAAYGPRKANIIVYNAANATSVQVSLPSGVLSQGDNYEIRDVQDYFTVPLASGTYNGNSITINMPGSSAPVARPLTVPIDKCTQNNLPAGCQPSQIGSHTDREFGAFVLCKGSCTPGRSID